jgi:cytidyltransferase-like protein
VRKKALIVRYKDFVDVKKLFKNKKTVLVGGCFDLIHYGHLRFLEKAAEQGNFLIVALESDGFIKNNKRKKPFHRQLERAEILSYLNMVDLIIMLPPFNSHRDYQDLVKKISPRVIAITRGDQQLENKKKQAEEVGAELVEVITNLKKFSTRNIAKVFNL